ncbi:hypothetical protein [Candidatus Phytoplasma pini]|uniref:Uncharacterized protein n=1 Tax=Candidatus Phytoplasma pini TaxID=267362 RepID=A0A559KJ06_9MOLU|nr:hypothetical protein [Candidatus Phytoplasma pini]TVY12111.1 hypothetical protein MDPP_00348 [Candidatus Phytoplasma pini]
MIFMIIFVVFWFLFGFKKIKKNQDIVKFNLLNDKIHNLRFKEIPEKFLEMEKWKFYRKEIVCEIIKKIDKQIGTNSDNISENRKLLKNIKQVNQTKQVNQNEILELKEKIYKLEKQNDNLENDKLIIEKYKLLEQNLKMQDEYSYKELSQNPEYEDFIKCQDKFLEIKKELIDMFYKRFYYIAIQNLNQFYLELNSFLKDKETQKILDSLEEKTFINDIKSSINEIERYLNLLKQISEPIQNNNNIKHHITHLESSFIFLQQINKIYFKILQEMQYKDILYVEILEEMNDKGIFYKHDKNIKIRRADSTIEIITKKFPNEIYRYEEINSSSSSRKGPDENIIQKFLTSPKKKYKLFIEKEWCIDYIKQFERNFPENLYNINHIKYDIFNNIFKSETEFRKYFFQNDTTKLNFGNFNNLLCCEEFTQNPYYLDLKHFQNKELISFFKNIVYISDLIQEKIQYQSEKN